MLPSCTSNVELQSGRMPIRLTTSIALTRATTQDTQLASGEKVTVWAFEQSGTGAAEYSDAYIQAWALTADGSGNLTSDNTTHYYYPARALTLVGVHGNFSAGAFTEGTTAMPATLTHSIATDQHLLADYVKGDLLRWETHDRTATATAIAASFEHQLSKIVIELTSSEYSDAELDKAIVRIGGIQPTITLNTQTAALSGLTGAASILIPYKTGQVTYEAIVPPQAKAADLISISLNGWTTLVTPAEPASSFAAGTKYTYTVTVSRTAVSVQTQITPWTDVAGAAETTIGPNVDARFSVAPGRAVQFSPGNLQAHISAGPTDTYNYTASEWKFAATPWEYLFNPLDADAVTNKEWVDHFGWVGTTANWDTYGLCTSVAMGNSTYYGTDGDGDALKTDWGSIPGVIAACGPGWRTLTNDEWGYVFDTRETGTVVDATTHARYTLATIRTDVSGGVNGIILFPDGVTFAASEFATLGTLNAGSAWTTKCTAAQWAALNAKGCVFLPAAGYRYGAGLDVGGSYGYYWSASPGGAGYARLVFFYSGVVNPHYNDVRRNGFAVRLVRDVPPAATSRKTTIAEATTADLAVGDIVCSDGSIFAAANAAAVAAEGRTPVGVIAFVNDGTSIGNAATENGRGRNTVKSLGRALVIGAMNVGGTAGNATLGTNFAYSTGTAPFTNGLYCGDTDEHKKMNTPEFYWGFDRTAAMNSSTWPAAQAAYNFNALPAPALSTGWFLPSAGQWKKILIHMAEMPSNDYRPVVGDWYGQNTTLYPTYVGNLNNKLNVLSDAGAEIVNTIPVDATNWYWTHTEFSATYVTLLVWVPYNGTASTGIKFINNSRNSVNPYVRPVFAF